MTLNPNEKKQRKSLTYSILAIFILTELVVTILVGLFVALLVHFGAFELSESNLSLGPFIVSIIIGTLAIGALLSWLASYFLLKPIKRILDSLNSLSMGDYSSRLHYKGRITKINTVAEFTEGFNAMATELENTEMLRSDFINNFSHEFKTPIVSIAGFAKLLKRGNLTPEQQKEYLDIIEEESLRLSQMATNVLNLTKVENQTILTGISNYNLTEQIRSAVLLLENKWSKNHLELSLPENEYFIKGNEELMMQVWINLLDNAIKFSQEYGVLGTEINKTDNGLDIMISNFGEPIPQESLNKIFNKFYQADESHSTEGSGVGLAIAKKIVELHNGQINVICKNGKTTFAVSLPVV